ncbi:MAG: glutamate--tRNA ligase [Candidatus Gracilibacteria bacterium]|nr:glutamate--tRNA ligase [Candidatus Gracilibacteria bacterium]
MAPRTRFAPSPTGAPHIGHLRTAMYAWLEAKKNGGIFFMRLEDTDQERFVAGSADILIDCIKWIGIEPDEGFMGENVPEKGEYGPYVQSKRKDLYKKYALELIEKGAAFYCFCPKQQEVSEVTSNLHDHNCRNLSKEEIETKLAKGTPYIIRHKIPLNEHIIIEDMVHGTQKIDTNTLDDSVLLKSDGHATYHLAHLVDDHLMKTTHVVRGEEWLPSLPKHTLLFKQAGFEAPKYVHLALIMIIDKETGTKRKFSKRKGDPGVIDIMQKGYLPEAVFNYLVFLGWNPGEGETKEFYTKEELINVFDLADCNKSGALFDIEKLNWMNSKYIANLETNELYTRIEEYLTKYDKDFYENIFSKSTKEFNIKILKELKTRLRYLGEYKELTTFIYGEPNARTDLLLNPKMKIDNIEIVKKGLKLALDILNSDSLDFSELDNIKDVFVEKIATEGLKNGQVLWPIRVALSGEEFSPGAFELIYILGKEKSIQRIQKIFEKI